MPATASDWIPIAERLPEDGQVVLIGGTGYKGWFWSDALYKHGKFLMFDQERDDYLWLCEDPSHWMPVPPAPDQG
jgi:hypothetical protein